MRVWPPVFESTADCKTRLGHQFLWQANAAAEKLNLIRPFDRNGKTAEKQQIFSTSDLEHALDRYRKNCIDAAQEVRKQLELLSDSVKARCNPNCVIGHASCMARSLQELP